MACSAEDQVTSALARFFAEFAKTNLVPKMDALEVTMNEVKGKLTSLESTCACLQEKSSVLEKAIGERALTRQVKEIEDYVRQKAEATRVDQLAQLVESLRSDTAELRNMCQLSSESHNHVQGKFKQTESKLQNLEQSVTTELRRVQSGVDDVRSQHGASEKAIKQEMQQQSSAIARTNSDLRDVEQSVGKKACLAQLQQLGNAVSTAEGRLGEVERAVQGKASSENIQDLLVRMPGLEKAVKDSLDRVGQFDENIANISKQATSCENALREKVSFNQMRQFEAVLSGLNSQISAVEQSVQEKVTTNMFQKLRADLNASDAKLTDLEQAVSDKTSSSQLQQLKSALMGHEAKIGSVEQAMQDKVGSGQIQQLKSFIMSTQSQVAAIESSLKEKVGDDKLQQVAKSIGSVQAHINNVEQSLQEKISVGEVNRVKAAVASAESKIGNLEHGLQEKVGAGDVQAVTDMMAGLQSKMSNLERSVWEGMDCAAQLESSISAVKAQCASIEHAGRDRVTTEDFKQFGDRIAGVVSKVSTLERAVCSGSDRMQVVEETVTGLNDQFGAFRQALQSKVVGHSRQLQLTTVQIHGEEQG